MNWAIDLAQKYAPTEGQANIYGVIIYTDAHAYVKKVLDDDDYWRALDEISGPQWAVFATKGAKGYLHVPTLPPGVISYLVPVWKEPKANKELLEVFELDSTEDLPVLVVFAQNEEGEVYKTVMKIDESSQESAFESIKSILKTISQSLEKVDEENLASGASAYHAVRYGLHNYLFWQRVKRAVLVWQWLMSMK